MTIMKLEEGIKLLESVCSDTVLLCQAVRPDRNSQGILIVTNNNNNTKT